MGLLVVIVVAFLIFLYCAKKNDALKDTEYYVMDTQRRINQTPKSNYANSMRNSVQINDSGERMDRLTSEGDLPWGWEYQNQSFIDKATAEYIRFSKEYSEHEYGHPKKKYAALKTLLLYIEDAKKNYAKLGECYLFWFVETWAKDEEVKELYSELRYIEEHYDELEEKYERSQYIKHILIPEIKRKALEVVKENPGIIQTDAYSYFAPEVKTYVQGAFNTLSKEGKIKREKHGRTYKLSI